MRGVHATFLNVLNLSEKDRMTYISVRREYVASATSRILGEPPITLLSLPLDFATEARQRDRDDASCREWGGRESRCAWD